MFYVVLLDVPPFSLLGFFLSAYLLSLSCQGLEWAAASQPLSVLSMKSFSQKAWHLGIWTPLEMNTWMSKQPAPKTAWSQLCFLHIRQGQGVSSWGGINPTPPQKKHFIKPNHTANKCELSQGECGGFKEGGQKEENW